MTKIINSKRFIVWNIRILNLFVIWNLLQIFLKIYPEFYILLMSPYYPRHFQNLIFVR